MHTMNSNNISVAQRLRHQLKERYRIDAARRKQQRAMQNMVSAPGVVSEVPPAVSISLALAIVSCDIADRNTLCNTLRSIRKSGFNEKITVFYQGKMVDEKKIRTCATNVEVILDTKSKGLYANWCNAARWMLSMTPAKWIMIMQDDIEWCRAGATLLINELYRIETGTSVVAYNDVGVLSPYTSPAMVTDNPARGWNDARFYGRTPGLWGALALCFTRESLDTLLHTARFVCHKSERALDYIVGDSLRFHTHPEKRVMVYVPSLVDHTGDTSTIFQAKQLTSPSLKRLRHGFRYTKDLIL